MRAAAAGFIGGAVAKKLKTISDHVANVVIHNVQGALHHAADHVHMAPRVDMRARNVRMHQHAAGDIPESWPTMFVPKHPAPYSKAHPKGKAKLPGTMRTHSVPHESKWVGNPGQAWRDPYRSSFTTDTTLQSMRTRRVKNRFHSYRKTRRSLMGKQRKYLSMNKRAGVHMTYWKAKRHMDYLKKYR